MSNGLRIFIIATGFIVFLALRQSVAEPRVAMHIVPTPQEPQLHEPSISDLSSCDLKEKTYEALTMLSSANPQEGSKIFRWTEERLGKVRPRKDVQRELALALMRTDTCEVEQVIVAVQGDNILSPEGYEITPVERNNGILMNRWNTQFRAKCPGDGDELIPCVVVGNVEPDKKSQISDRTIYTAQGAWKTVPAEIRGTLYRIYVPYSADLHSWELVRYGEDYVKNLSKEVFDLMRQKEVKSKASPGNLIVDVEYLTPELLQWLTLSEQMDVGEFILEPERTAERVYVIYGTNEHRAFIYTCSNQDACGAYQFTDNWIGSLPGTYTTLRRRYPEAQLMENFQEGTQDLVNIAQAALLHLDSNANYLLRRFGDELLEDPLIFAELIFVGYNTSITAVGNAYRDSLKHPDRDWPEFLKNKYPEESRGYVAKLRFLRDWTGPSKP